MKTNRNFFSKLSKVTLTLSLAILTVASVSCQNSARQAFHYKTDFIKQMVYQVSNEFLASTGIAASNNQNKAKATLVSYSVAEKSNKKAASVKFEDATLFFTEAAALNAPVAIEESVETDNTLDFLTEAASFNAPVADLENENTSELNFFTSAAQLNSEVAADNSDDNLDFLTSAAQINAPVASEVAQDDTLDFLTTAAHLFEQVAE